MSELSKPVRTLVESAYGQGIGEIFFIAAPLAGGEAVVPATLTRPVPVIRGSDARA